MKLMEDGSDPGTPTPSCTAQKPGRGLSYTAFLLLLHLLVRYTLHGKQGTTHTPASCVKKCIYSAHTWYSIATKATTISLKNQQNTNFKATTKTSKSSPPCSTDLWPSGPNKPPVASDRSPTPSLPGKAQEGGPRSLAGSPASTPNFFCGAEGTPTRGAGPAICCGALLCSYLGDTPNKENGTVSGLNREAATDSLGLDKP